MLARHLCLFVLIGCAVSVSADRKRASINEAETDKGSVKVEVIVQADDMKIVNETQTESGESATEYTTTYVEPVIVKPKIRPFHHQSNTNRKDNWYLRPSFPGPESKNGHVYRAVPSSRKTRGRWWYYKGSYNRGRRFLGKYHVNRY